jgi:hypothetical protein
MKVKIKDFYEREEIEDLPQITPIASVILTNDFGDFIYEFFITKSCSEAMEMREREYRKQREEKEKTEKREALLIECLAELEHEQWWEWSREIVKKEPISLTRRSRWESFWIPYGLLSEETKEHDRKWARKVLKAVRDNEAFWREKDIRDKK